MRDLARLREMLAEGVAPQVALMRLMLTGLPAADLLSGLRVLTATAPEPRVLALLHLAEASREGLATLERMVASGADHLQAASAADGVEAAREMFDRLVTLSPEASVAAYSLGDPARLAEATAEVVDWLRGLGLLEGRPVVLDLGCGIGRFCAALAPHASAVVGLEVSEGMARVARRRLEGIAGTVVLRGSGHDLAPIRDAAFGLVLAADVFPYLVQASPGLAARHLAEARRVLRPGGSLVILNYSYRGAEVDRRELPMLAAEAGLEVMYTGEAPFQGWDGAAYWLRRGEEATRSVNKV